jgi:hypothetical protein
MVPVMTETERYARQTRNAAVTIAVLMVVGVVVGVLLALVSYIESLPDTSPAPAPEKILRLCDVNPTYAC